MPQLAVRPQLAPLMKCVPPRPTQLECTRLRFGAQFLDWTTEPTPNGAPPAWFCRRRPSAPRPIVDYCGRCPSPAVVAGSDDAASRRRAPPTATERRETGIEFVGAQVGATRCGRYV